MKKILVIDDEKDVRDLIRDLLEQEKFKVFTAEPQDALTAAKVEGPDLILLDIAMPQFDGYTICEKIKSEEVIQDIPVVFLTGKELSPEGIAEHCRKLKAVGYISKLSSPEDFLSKVRSALYQL
jgi:two-component system alkaline phosphatase synthesis response regulator PhoP